MAGDITKEYDNILKKIDVINKLTDYRINKVYDKKEYITINGIKIASKGKRDFKYLKKGIKDEELEVFKWIDKGEFLDHFLYSILDITINHANSYWASFAGRYSLSKKITMNNAHHGKDVLYHEIGHAWAFQLTKKAGLDRWAFETEVVGKYLQLKSVDINPKKWSWYRYRNYIRKYISYYAGKNIDEAYAELFMIGTVGNYDGVDMDAQKVLKESNLKLTQLIWNKLIKYSNKRKCR